MGREFELKFSARPEQLAALREKFGDFCAISMETTYYDTPNGDLSARRITLRRRLENGLSVCTLKHYGNQCGSISFGSTYQSALGCLCEAFLSTKTTFIIAGTCSIQHFKIISQ